MLDELVERASLGSILVTDTAASLLMRRFELTPSPGPPDKARAHVLIGRERTGLGLGGRLAQFVGRRQELDLLQSRLALAANGRGQVVGIVGDAGIGKSRLVFEFHQSEGGRVAAFLLGHCHAWGAAAPYLPVLEILRASCGIAETDTTEDVVVKLGAATRAMSMGDEERDVLAQFLGMKIEGERLAEADPQAFKARTFEALRQLTIRRSRQGPLVLLLEDVHWIDRASEEYFTSLVDALVGTRIILVCTYRAGYRPPWIDKSFATQMALQPLGREDGLSLARASSGAHTFDATLLETIAAKAEGNPFFVEELVRAVREQGGESTAAVPATIEEVLRSRLDRLESLDQRLLQHAAVIGRQVPLSVLEALVDVPPDALRSGLGRLSSAEFLYELPRGFELEYCFKHTLTHEVVYASLEAAARRGLHARVVEVMERAQTEPGGEVVERLAHHAYHGGLWDKAVGYLREAGAHAAARGAHREAVADYEQALAALAHLPTEHSTEGIDLRFDLRTSLLPLGEHRRIFDVLREAEVMADAIGDRGRLGRACAYLTNAFFISGNQEQGLAYGRRALAIADALGDGPLQAEAKLRLGQVHHALGEYSRAIEMLSGPVDTLTGDLLNARFGLPLIFSVGCRTWLARALSELGHFELGLQRADEAVNIAAAAGHTYSLAVAHWSVGHLHLQPGRSRSGHRGAHARRRARPHLGHRGVDHSLRLGPRPGAGALGPARRGGAAARASRHPQPVRGRSGVLSGGAGRRLWIGRASGRGPAPRRARARDRAAVSRSGNRGVGAPAVRRARRRQRPGGCGDQLRSGAGAGRRAPDAPARRPRASGAGTSRGGGWQARDGAVPPDDCVVALHGHADGARRDRRAGAADRATLRAGRPASAGFPAR